MMIRKNNPMEEKIKIIKLSTPEKQKLVNVQFGGLNRCDYCLMLFKSKKVHAKTCQKKAFEKKNSTIIGIIGVSCENNCGFTSNREGLKVHNKTCQKNIIEKFQSEKPTEKNIENVSSIICDDKNKDDEVMQVDDPLDILEVSTNSGTGSPNSGTGSQMKDDTKSNENSVEFEKQVVDNLQNVDEDIEIIFEGSSMTFERNHN